MIFRLFLITYFLSKKKDYRISKGGIKFVDF